MAISIGISFYNAEKFLADAIRSVFAQTYQDWELILIDDGSTDASLDIALSVKDSRVRVISDGFNRKLPYRLNQITSEATHDFVARMDADDLISPTRLEKEIQILKENPEIDIVSTGVCSLTNDSIPVGTRCGSIGDIITGRKLLLGQSGIVHASVLARKNWFLRNPYNEKLLLVEDYELWLRSFANDDLKIHIIHEPLYYYREEGNVTAQKMITAYSNQVRQLVTYGYLGFNSAELFFVICKFKCKSLVVRVLDRINKCDILLKNRNSPILEDVILDHFVREINFIQSTELA